MAILTHQQTPAGTERADIRLGFRLDFEHKKTIEQAARISGLTVSDFLRHHALKTSHDIIEQHAMRVLSDRDRDRFIAIMTGDYEPNDAAKLAAARHKQARLEGKR